MQNNSRTYNSIKNLFFGLGSQVIILILNFVSRTIFIKTLGTEYLGVNGLFSNILTVLSLAELGIGNAIIYSMYKPLANGNTGKIVALMNMYKKLYNIIAAIILTIGLLLVPFLKYLVNTDMEMDKIIVYYLLFLLNSVVSYLFASRTSILNADQKMYIVKAYTMVFTVLQQIVQIILLYITHNFILYLTVQIIFTFLTNLYGAIKAHKMYPYLSGKDKLAKNEKKEIFSNIKSIFMYRIGGVILNNTDNILISIIIGTVYVGYYSNYYMVINAITTFTTLIFTSITASIGNLNASGNETKKYEVFTIINFCSAIVFGFISICLMILFNDFIQVWIGKEFMMNMPIIVAIVLNFYLVGRLNPISTYRDTLGMFRKTRYIFMITAVINIILSVILGKLIGLFGIIIATAIARIITNRWYEPLVLYKDYFKINILNYWKSNFYYVLCTIINYGITYLLINKMMVTGLGDFIGKAVLCCVINGILFILEFYHRNEFKNLLGRMKIKKKDNEI